MQNKAIRVAALLLSILFMVSSCKNKINYTTFQLYKQAYKDKYEHIEAGHGLTAMASPIGPFCDAYYINCSVLTTFLQMSGAANIVIFNGLDNARQNSFFIIVPANARFNPINNGLANNCFIQDKKGICPTVCDYTNALTMILGSDAGSPSGGYYCSYATAQTFATNYFNSTAGSNTPNEVWVGSKLYSNIISTIAVHPYMSINFLLDPKNNVFIGSSAMLTDKTDDKNYECTPIDITNLMRMQM
jgi:hypothetical protein